MHRFLAGALAAACLLGPGGCASTPPFAEPGAFDAAALSAYMARMGGRDAEARRAEARRLGAAGSAEDRLKLAWLLSQDGFAQGGAARGQELLAGLEGSLADPLLQEYVRLLRQSLAQEALLRKEHQRAEELQGKIDRLKDLERDLLDLSKSRPPVRKPPAPSPP